MVDMPDVADGCVDGCCTVVQMAAEQHPDLRLDLEDWLVAKLKGLEHPDWRLAEDLVAVEESVISDAWAGTTSSTTWNLP